tara:strand:+ start:2457 stop:3362 length:906 start_codon:yes stop_codon:yes gene_type:complete
MLDKFLKNGWLDLGQTLNRENCEKISSELLNSRPWDETVFREYTDVFNTKRHLNVTPSKGGYNLAEKFDLSFIEENHLLNDILNEILGENYEIILKKFVVSAPQSMMPKWLIPIVDKKLDGNLAQYIKPQYRDISYFSGIDYHMDLLDYANFNGDYVTIYIYLTDVNNDQSPLNLISASHKYGATFFPHFLKLSKNKNKILYSKNGKNFDEFDKVKLVSKAGRIYLWSALTLHGTLKSLNSSPRVALRYSIKKNNINNKKKYLIDDLYKGLEIRLDHKTRTDVTIKSDQSIKYSQNKRFLV